MRENLFFDEEAIEAIRRRAANARYRAVWEQIRRTADDIAERGSLLTEKDTLEIRVSRPQLPICIPLKQSQLFHSFHIWLCIVRMDLCRERPYQGAGHGTQQQEDSRRPQIFKTKLFPSLHLCPLLPFSFSFTQIPVVPLSCRLNTASRIIFSSSWTSSSNAAANSGIGSPEGRCRSTFMFSSRG